MAEKRMFTQKIIDSDAFLEMPLSAQALYFHLNMRADDDGFVNNPKKITRYVNASDDDLKLLAVKRFIIAFDTGVIVIKHWRMHNTLKSDRYHPTDYQEEFAMLGIKENKAYTEVERNQSGTKVFPVVEPERNQVGISLETQNRIDKNRIDLDKIREDSTFSNEKVCCTDVQRVVDAWNTLGLQKVTKVVADTKRGQWLHKRIADYGLDEVLRAIEKVRASSFLNGNNSTGWTITFDWFLRPNNFPKVLDGNYDNRGQGGGPGDQDTDNMFLQMLRDRQ